MGFCSQEVTSYHLQGELKPRAADHRASKKTGRSAPEPTAQGTLPKVFSMDDVMGWIVMTVAVVPAVLTLLLAWSGSNRRPIHRRSLPVTSGRRQTRCLIIKPKSGAPLSCLDRKKFGGTNGGWDSASSTYSMPRSSLPLLRSSLSARSVVRRLLGKPTKEYSDGKH